MKLIFIRHGQTDSNLANLINGLNEEPLNEKGIRQATELMEKLDINYDFIMSSPLLRAKQTAEIINSNNKKISIDNRIQERDAGSLTLTKVPDDESDWWNYNPQKDYKEAESVKKVINRVYDFINEIKDRYHDKEIIVVTHGGVLKCVYTYFNNIPQNGDLSLINYDNCEIIKYEL